MEHACQILVDDLKLGTERLHRVAGASTGSSSEQDETKIHRTIGISFLPLGFFEANPDIVILGSAFGRHGY